MTSQAREIVISRTILTSPARVYAAFTCAEGWCGWCCERAECDARVGGKLHIYTEGYNAYGEFRELEQDRSVAFTWDGDGEPPTLIHVSLDGDNDSTVMTFQVTGLCSEQEWAGLADSLERTWTRVLNNLKAVLETESRSCTETAVQGNTEFALELYQQLRAEKGNLFFSPYSISAALAMTYAGARGNTEIQMAQALHFLLAQEELHPAFALLEAKLGDIGRRGDVQIKVANALWPDVGYQFLEEFLALTEKHYGASITPLYYSDPEAARQKINGWVEGKTEEKIKELIPPGILDSLTRLVLVNAIYFKGNWASQFEKELTEAAPFMVTATETVQAPMMTQEHTFRYGESSDVQVLELPYVGGDLAMIILLPRKVDGLVELETALTVENLEKWTGDLWDGQVRVLLPRFKVSQGFKLNDALISMGMGDAFDQSKANFSGMDGCVGSLYIAAALHKAFVDVNEEGTEAAASTAVVMGLRYAPPPPPVFRADHPFVFMIREKSTGSILFLGRVVNPVQGDG
ncbi:MAG: SRPBCC domain-containing protein [Anaerolineae bacterium]|nr:SRPBCC domain-containing protein [Anaerolineae bacterium]